MERKLGKDEIEGVGGGVGGWGFGKRNQLVSSDGDEMDGKIHAWEQSMLRREEKIAMTAKDGFRGGDSNKKKERRFYITPDQASPSYESYV